LNKIDNGLSNKQKRLLLKYVSYNFGSAISEKRGTVLREKTVFKLIYINFFFTLKSKSNVH